MLLTTARKSSCKSCEIFLARDKRSTWVLGCMLFPHFTSKLKVADQIGRQYYAFDVVGEFTFQKKLGFLEKGSDVDDMMKTIEGILFYSATIGQVPELHPFLLGNPILPHLIPVRLLYIRSGATEHETLTASLANGKLEFSSNLHPQGHQLPHLPNP